MNHLVTGKPVLEQPHGRENLHQFLVEAYEAGGDPRGAGEKRISSQRLQPAKLFAVRRTTDLGAFFLLVVGSMIVGMALAYLCGIGLEQSRRAVSGLFPAPVPGAVYLYLLFLGAMFGTWLGCTRVAPCWVQRRR